MSKYIDADKLIAEIERRLNIVEPHKDTFESAAACRQELIWMKEFIASLQQEQPEVNIWHDVKKESPTNFGAEIIVLCKNKNKEDGIWLADLIQCFEGEYKPRENWEDPVKWAYLSEILPQRD